MADDVDKLFEDIFGFGSKPEPKAPVKAKPKPEPKPVKVDPPPPEPEPEPEPEGSVEDAAKAVAKALEEHHAKKGARKVKLVFWRPAVSKALGIKRIYEARLLEVIRKGVSMGLFELNEEGSFPHLIPFPEEEIDPEWEAYQTRRAAEQARREAEAVEHAARMAVQLTTPENWDPPGFLECGHWTWQQVRLTEEECSPTELKRFQDPQGVKPYKVVRAHSPEECLYCGLGLRPNSYQHLKGKYKKPVPERSRRTVEKEGGPGYPGLCCDDDGYYIGGLVNLCTYANPKGPHCIVHRRGGSKNGDKA